MTEKLINILLDKPYLVIEFRTRHDLALYINITDLRTNLHVSHLVTYEYFNGTLIGEDIVLMNTVNMMIEELENKYEHIS